MRQVNTPSGYLAIERIGGIDVYMEDCIVCELCCKTLDDFSYDGKIDKDKLEKAIEDEIELVDLVEKLREEM
jgi:hypothetical protein